MTEFDSASVNQLATDIREAYARGGDHAVVELLRDRIPQHSALSANIQMSNFAGGTERDRNYFDIGSGRVVNQGSLVDRDGAPDGRTEAGEVLSVFAASVLAGPSTTQEETLNLAESFSPYVCGCTSMPPASGRFR